MSPFRAAAILVLLTSFVAPSFAAPGGTYLPGPTLRAEAHSKELCESKPGRIFVEIANLSECVAYTVTEGNEDRREAVFFFNGDAPPEANAAAFEAAGRADQQLVQKIMVAWSQKLHIRYFNISRLGVQGSSGDPHNRRNISETVIMGTATKLLAARYGIDKFAIVGQSGGSTIGAGMLVMGFRNIACAVLGSGAYDVLGLLEKSASAHHAQFDRTAAARTIYSPFSYVSRVKPDPGRRIFILGDAQDPKADFSQQARFAAGLRAGGNNATLFEISAFNHHGAANIALPAAGYCLRGAKDDSIKHIVDALSKMQRESQQAMK